MGTLRIRLDVLLAEKGMVESRNQAQALIMSGKVRVDGQVMTKPGVQVSDKVAITIEQELPYVSRGGLKLAAALAEFQIDPTRVVCADIGASTGGFTDVLLQQGAARVYAIDVGYGQLDWKLRQDGRVVVMERTNARYLEALPEPVNLVTIDASFISLQLIMPVVKKWLTTPGLVIALIKPQFEAGRRQVGRGGVVRDRSIHKQVLTITGPAGNHEFFLCLGWQTAQSPIEIAAAIEACLAKLPPDFPDIDKSP
jgi:23S rRNA (cytidine1920-2'-O)/16S rRNA (cytidine1409-2'-O)-methyltransferase